VGTNLHIRNGCLFNDHAPGVKKKTFFRYALRWNSFSIEMTKLKPIFMKRIFRILTLASLVFMLACDARRESDSDNAYDNDDSKEVAEEANDEKFEDNDMEKDADFVANTVAANYGEIKFAELANQRSSNPEVKKAADMLIKDHTKSLNELKTMAQSKAITVPVEADDEAKRKTERFSDEAGKDFDKKWCKEMVDKHDEMINKFEKRMEKTEDADIKAWIGKTLPVLKTHREHINAVHEKIKDTNT
jgi:putative membrane protein